MLLSCSCSQVVLKGIAIQDNSSAAHKQKLEQSLEQEETTANVKKIIDDILKGIQTPDR